MEFRKANIEEIDKIMEIIEDGRSLLKIEGNGQWQFGYPNIETIRNDINNGESYVIVDNGEIICTLAATHFDEEYEHILKGHWMTNGQYLVMHRCAIKAAYRNKGIGLIMFEYFEQLARAESIKSLRIDTHENNIPMNKLMKKMGYVVIGWTILKPDKERLLFEKVLED